MRTRCPNCDRIARLQPGELCQRCRDDLRFVVRPEAHREMERRRLATAARRAERPGVVVVVVVPPDNSFWACDSCDTRIAVAGEFTLIPLRGGKALCPECASRHPFWPDGWTQPQPRPCRCGPCQTPIATALERVS